MAVATISVNFATAAEARSGTSSITSINPLQLRNALTSGSALTYDLDVKGARFRSNTTIDGLTIINNSTESDGVSIAAVNIAGGTIIQKKLHVIGTTTLKGCTVDTLLLTANNGLTVNNNPITANNGATIYGIFTAEGGLTVKNGLIVQTGGITIQNSGALLVTGTSNTTGLGTFNGGINVNNQKLVANAGLEVTGSSQLKSGLDVTGAIVASGNITSSQGTLGTNGIGTRYISTAGPSGGVEGDIWLQY